jgi:hypothetical protein
VKATDGGRAAADGGRLRATIFSMSQPTPAASHDTPAAPLVRGQDHAPKAQDARPRGRMVATGAAALLVAFATVQASGCGYKTPLEMPKKAAPAKPAS